MAYFKHANISNILKWTLQKAKTDGLSYTRSLHTQHRACVTSTHTHRKCDSHTPRHTALHTSIHSETYKLLATNWVTSQVRFQSTGGQPVTDTTTPIDGQTTQPPPFPDGYIPEPPPIPSTEGLPSGDVLPTDQIVNQIGDVPLAELGLAGWTPPGFIQWGLEMIHVDIGLPWWGSVVLGTVILRCCLFPLVIMAQKNSARMANHMPTIQRLQSKFSYARSSSDQMAASRAAQELQEYMQRNDIKIFRSFATPLAQVPVFLSVFMALRGMANLPVASLTTGGTLWFSDLTMTDPFYALPAITALTLLVTLEVGTDGIKSQSMTTGMRYFMRALPFITLPFMCQFPTVLLCYWFTSNTFSLMQVSFLRIPSVRDYFQIPEHVKHPPADENEKKSFMEGVRENMKNSRKIAEMQHRQQYGDRDFKKSGQGPVPKTYKYNPKVTKDTDKYL